MRNDALKPAGDDLPPPQGQSVSYPPQTPAERVGLLKFIRGAAFTYGTWNRFKSLYKSVEADPDADAEVLGALIGRIDDSSLYTGDKHPRVSFDGMHSIGGLLAWKGRLFVVKGNNYYSQTNGKELTVFAQNLDDPLNPAQVAALDFGMRGQNLVGLARCGSRLCIAVRDRANTTVRVIDASDPLRPFETGKFTVGGSAALASDLLSDSSLYLSITSLGNSAFQGLCIVEFDASGEPQIVGEVSINGLSSEEGNIAVAGGLAALITKPVGLTWRSLPRNGGLHLIDVATPRRAGVTGNLDLQTPLCVSMRGTTVYVGIGSNVPANIGLQVVDASDPRRPRKAGFVPLPAYPAGLTVSPNGNHVYVRTQRGQLFTIDVTDSQSPRLVNTVDGYQGMTDMVAADGDLMYLPSGWQGVSLLSVARGEQPQRVGLLASAETIGYMKRRGRRFLRNLAKADPARYVDVATALLLGLAQKDEVARLDPARHWAAIDTLFGVGNRFRQTKHGRGHYVATAAASPKLRLRTREERFPAAWDAAPDHLWRLLSTPNLLPSVYGFAARALRANRQPLPLVSPGVLEQWVQSDDPLLIVLGVGAGTALLTSGQMLSPTLTADVFFQSSARLWKRLMLQSRISDWAGQRDWAHVFALRLAERLTLGIAAAHKTLTRRQLASSTLLARYFSWVFSTRPDVLLPLVAPLLVSGRADLEALIVAGAQHAARASLVAWLTQVGLVPDPQQREPAVAALAGGVEGVSLDPAVLRGLVFNTDSFVREAGWRLIVRSEASGEALRMIWTELLTSGQATPAVSTAMASPDALGLLQRAGITTAEFVGYINARPHLGATLSPAAFSAVAATAPAPVVLALITASADDHWADIRPVLLRQLREGVGLDALWLAAEAAMVEDATGRLEARLLTDPEMAETLLTVEDVRLLAIREPSFGPILGAWWNRHIELFARNSTPLFDAATHPLPEVRTPALARVALLGMDMTFALRLAESAVPPSVAVGRSFFDAEPAGGDREADYALALCDSPASAVRSLGREYVTQRWETLPHERILGALFENPAPEVQAFVADRLGTPGVRVDSAPAFDAEVLRSTNRARLAKERIKVRQTSESTLDIATLLTVARGRTPRDAEWALGELARRVARGEIIEGIAVDGVAGI